MSNLHSRILLVGSILFVPLLCFSQGPEQSIDKEFTRNNSVHANFFEWARQFTGMGRSYAVVIGVSNYQKNGFPKLESPQHDAIRVKDFLLDQEFDRVYVLTNAAATPERVGRLMDEVIPALAGRNDRFLFYFSGHGTQRQVGSKTLGYLALADSGPTEYSKMIDMESVRRWDELLEPTRHVLFVLDSCFSGLAGIQAKSSPKDMELRRLSQYAHYLITAGSADEISVASLERWGGSLFTSAFISGASGRADTESSDFGKDGVISLKKLMIYIGGRIDSEKSSMSGIKMSPQMSALQASSEGEFFFLDQGKKNYVPDAASVAKKYGAPVQSYGQVLDYAKVPDDLQEVFLAVKNMVEMSNADNPPLFFVGVWKYYIEGEPYRASGLTISPGHFRNLQQTQTGFEGDAFFTKNLLSAKAIVGKEPNPAGLYQVHMRIDLKNIFTIVGKKREGEGQEIHLLESRHAEFD